MTRFVRLASLLVLTAPLLVAAGCKQGEGDRCQVQSDCSDNLICVLPAGGTPQSGGTCQKPGGAGGDLGTAAGADMTAAAGDMTGITPADMSNVSGTD